MRVGVILNDLQPHFGGGYTFQSEVFESILRLKPYDNLHFTFFGPKEWRDKYFEKRLIGLDYVIISRPNLFTRLIYSINRYFPVVRRYLRRFSPLERRLMQNRINFVWFISAGGHHALDIPYMTVVWDLMHLTHPWFPEVSARGEWYRREVMYRELLKRATIIITGTKTGKKDVSQYYQIHDERIKIIPHPTPTLSSSGKKMPSSFLGNLRIGNDFILYPAQFWPHKNHIVLVESIAYLNNEKEKNYDLIFIGSDKGNRRYIERYVNKLNLNSYVHFLGFVSKNNLIELYQNAFVLVYPSLCGPENMPPLEAFVLGCPVIAADIPGAREQLENAALFVDPFSPKMIAKKINYLFQHPDLRRHLIKEGKRRAESWTGMDYVLSIVDELFDVQKKLKTWC